MCCFFNVYIDLQRFKVVFTCNPQKEMRIQKKERKETWTAGIPTILRNHQLCSPVKVSVLENCDAIILQDPYNACMISWNHPTNITSPLPSCQNASPLVLFLPKIQWSSSDLPGGTSQGVHRCLARWLHRTPNFCRSPRNKTLDFTTKFSRLLGQLAIKLLCQLLEGSLGVFCCSWLPKSHLGLWDYLSFLPGSLSSLQGDQKKNAHDAALFFKAVVALASYRFWKSCWASGMFQSYCCPPLLDQLPTTLTTLHKMSTHMKLSVGTFSKVSHDQYYELVSIG